MDFKLDYSRFSRCFGESLVQKTVETINISPIPTYANCTTFLMMPGNAMFAFKASLVRFTLRQVGSFVQNYLFARNPQYTKISATGATLR